MTPEAMRKVAIERLRERARRIGLIRRSVVAGAVATFVLAWGLALSDQIAHGTKTSPNDSIASTASGVSASGDESDDGAVVSAPTTVAPTTVTPSPAPLTTSQS